MNGYSRWTFVMLGLGLMLSAPSTASAQYVIPYYPPAVSYYAPPATVSYSYYPSVSYYAPTTVYSAPVYSVPVYSAPVAAYYPPTIASTGVITTRSYFGLGIFRPYGWNSVSTYRPTGVYVNPGRVSYYPW
jgi:hypothetical protein